MAARSPEAGQNMVPARCCRDGAANQPLAKEFTFGIYRARDVTSLTR
jgi:hypothetical protein